jgi:uncharacterized RDD family membrane protein YckC
LLPNRDQTHLPFAEALSPSGAVAVDEPQAPPPSQAEDFSFTLAIGRCSSRPQDEDPQLFIDVSSTSKVPEGAATPSAEISQAYRRGPFPVAPQGERALAAMIDCLCLLFAWGGFLALFGSLGGQFTVSKLSAAVYSVAFAIVYLQYFSLFTVFGGTTPGMMLRNLQVIAFSGDEPSPRQLLLRSAGYLLSGGTFCLGFLWALWDEDSLTWHDRMSRTFLSVAETLADVEPHAAVPRN